jgi:integrase
MTTTRGQGWLTIAKRKKGDVYIHHTYVDRATDGKRVEHCTTVGPVAKFAREVDVWEEVKRWGRADHKGRHTVASLVEQYRKNDQPSKAYSTQELHRHILDNYILARWGSTFVDEVRILDLKDWFVGIAKAKSLSGQTIQKIKQVFGRVYNFGIENELIPDNLNPVEKVNINGVGAKPRSSAIIVSPEIGWRIAMELSVQLRTLVLLAAGTGLRMSELLGLRWEDIDFETNTIHLRRTWLYGQIGEGKSAASRKPVVMGSRVAEFLLEWQRATPYAAETDWVFASFKLKGKRPISGSQFVKDYIRPAFERHGLIGKDYTGRAGLHAFRHSLATVLITEQGVDPKTVQGILRHASSALTMDLYTHSQSGPKRAALDLFESRMVQ